MSEAAQREWRLYLDDMISFAEKIMLYTDGLSQKEDVPNLLQKLNLLKESYSISDIWWKVKYILRLTDNSPQPPAPTPPLAIQAK